MTISHELAGLILGLLGGLIGGVVWMIRLESRVQFVTQRLDDHIKSAESAFRDLIRRMDLVGEKLDHLKLNCVAHQHYAPPSLGAGHALHRRSGDEDDEGSGT